MSSYGILDYDLCIGKGKIENRFLKEFMPELPESSSKQLLMKIDAFLDNSQIRNNEITTDEYLNLQKMVLEYQNTEFFETKWNKKATLYMIKRLLSCEFYKLALFFLRERREKIRKWIETVSQNEASKFVITEKVPDFLELYLGIADYLLLVKEHLLDAVLFYECATWDWLRGYEKINEKITREYESGRLSSSAYNDANTFDTVRNKQNDPSYSLDNEIHDKLFLLYKSAEKASIDNLVEISGEFFELLEETIQSNEQNVTELRIPVFIAQLFKKIYGGKIACHMASSSVFSDELCDTVVNVIDDSHDVRMLQLIAIVRNCKDIDFKKKLWDACTACVYVDRIKNALAIKDFKKDYGYYTSLKTFSYMLPLNQGDKTNDETTLHTGDNKSNKSDLCVGKLSIMHMSYMNDPNEGKALLAFLNVKQNPKEARMSIDQPYVFLKCFTPNIDFLPMWNTYGDAAKGCCLVLDTEKLQSEIGMPLYRIVYVQNGEKGRKLTKSFNRSIGDVFDDIVDNLKKLKVSCNSVHDRNTITHIVAPIIYLFKDANYSYEEEARILYVLDGGNDKRILKTKSSEGDANLLTDKLYISTEKPIAFKEIIIGPKFEKKADRLPYLQQQIEEMSRLVKVKMPKISESSIDYR